LRDQTKVKKNISKEETRKPFLKGSKGEEDKKGSGRKKRSRKLLKKRRVGERYGNPVLCFREKKPFSNLANAKW